MPPLWLLIPAAYLLVILALGVAGWRWQSVKPRASHTPNSPAPTAPEEGNH